MSETLELTKFCQQVESLFNNYHVTYLSDCDGVIYAVEIRAFNDIFATPFLIFLFTHLKSYMFFFESDLTGRPIIKIIVS